MRYRRHQQKAFSNSSNKFRVDVQGTFYSTIRYAYSHCPTLDAAHAMVYKRISKITSRPISVLYLDGSPAAEKEGTHQARERVRTNAVNDARKDVDEFIHRVDGGLPVHKQHFVKVKKNLGKAFQWDPEARASLARYFRERNWEVVESLTEADVEIARDCQEGDVVITQDSDLAMYNEVTTIWRLISGARFLEYKINEEVLPALGISRTQLTALGVVSHNDYNCNISGLGCATNFKIIKELHGMCRQ